MADTDLFMECEEEELEPWQRIEDDVVDDTGAEATPSSVNHFSSGVKSGFGPVSVSDVHSTEPAKKTLLTVLSSTNSVGASVMGSSRQPLIMTQSSSSLGSMTVSPVYQPTTLQVLQDPKTGSTSTVSGQPILITTQGFTVKDLRSVQNPLGIVLNVQSGQGITPYQAKPLTLVPATTQFMKSAVGVPQLWSPVTSIRPATTFPGTVTTVIPATVTIRSSTTSSPSNPHPQAKPQPLPQPPAHSQPQAPATLLQTGLKQGHIIHITNNDNKLVNFLQNTNLVRVSQKGPISSEAQRSKAEDLVKGSILPPLQTTTVTSTSSHQAKPTLNTTTAFKAQVADTSVNNGVPIPKACPKCNIHFNVMESLKLHMSYCCPSLVSCPTPPSKSTLLQCSAPQTKPPQTPGLVQGKLIMLVDDFYYGRDEGSTYQMLHQMKTSTTFRCLSCLKRLKNNIRFMNHMKHHLELERQNDDSIENHTTCQHCFRQYATPFLLQCHIDNVHSPYETTTKCKICELAFETEQLFLQHMKDTHKPGEMPYVCQVCDYRSSVYMEVDNHFRMIHEDTKNLLCPYCLKVLKNSSAYQQHYMKHQKKSVYPCNKCRLQFISAKEKLEHKTEHHKTFKKPKQLEGLQPGTKVTIRTSMGQARAIGGSSQESPPTKVYIAPQPHKPQDPPASSTTQLLAPVAKALPRLEKRKGVERTYTLLIDMQEFRNMYGDQVCLECNLDISNVSNHFPKYVHCSRCRYSTSCSRAYADHMISYHTLRGKPKYLMFGKVRKSGILLTCSSCSFTVDKADGDEMARHLDTNPAHKSCRILIFTGLLMKLLPKQRKNLLLWTATPQTSSTSSSSSSTTNTTTTTQPAPLSTTIFPLQQNPFTGPPVYEAKHSVIKIQTQKSLLLSAVCSSDYINVKASPAAGGLSALPSPTPPSETQHRLEGAGGKGGSPSQEPSGVSGLGAAHREQASDCLPLGTEDESGEEAGVGQCLSQGREEGGEDQSSGEAERGASSSLVAPSWPLGERELCVVLHALCCGAREAAEHYREPESRVVQWLGECASRLGGRAGAWDSPEEEEQLVEWVVLRREQQLPLTGEALAQRLLEAREAGGRRELRDTYERALALLLRWGLGAQVRATVGRRLTPGMEQDVTDFVDFTRRQLAAQSFPLAAIANVDEVPIFLDTAAKPCPGSEPGIRSDSLRLSGSGQPDLVVSLAILADGTLLPVLVSAHGPCPSWLRVPPGLLLEVQEEGYSEAEVARLWFSRVWQPYVRRRRQGHKTLLVLDSFRMHLSDTFIHQLGISNTLPLVVPQGCTARLQPLDMCLGPAFRRFLSHKWLAYARKVAGELLPRGDLLQSLLSWVSEAADFFSTNAELVRRSFLVAGLLPEPGWDADLRAHMQEELTSFLEEQLEEDGDSEGEGEGETGRLRADPKLLVKIFTADCDIESFHGFHESDM